MIASDACTKRLHRMLFNEYSMNRNFQLEVIELTSSHRRSTWSPECRPATTGDHPGCRYHRWSAVKWKHLSESIWVEEFWYDRNKKIWIKFLGQKTNECGQPKESLQLFQWNRNWLESVCRVLQTDSLALCPLNGHTTLRSGGFPGSFEWC